MKTLLGPFSQLLTMASIPLKGKVNDAQLEIIENAGIVVENNIICQAGNYHKLFTQQKYNLHKINKTSIVLPGFIDVHTHICYASERIKDFIERMHGKSYTEITKQGGGINTTVRTTRQATFKDLKAQTKKRAIKLLQNGITTAEVKSGYGLNVDDEIRMLNVINNLNKTISIDLIPTCLAAHVKPLDFMGSNIDYLKFIVKDLLPIIKEKNLCKRVDIFVEENAFNVNEARQYLNLAKNMGFQITIHGDQFTVGGSKLAVEIGAKSVDHLEVSSAEEIEHISNSNTVAVVLPGASLGMGVKFAPARKLLDKGASLVIASDWNPGSAPKGDLLTQVCILGMYEKLTPAEILAGITCRAANVLSLKDRGSIEKGKKADFVSFNCNSYQEIFYHQGNLKPSNVWKNGFLKIINK